MVRTVLFLFFVIASNSHAMNRLEKVTVCKEYLLGFYYVQGKIAKVEARRSSRKLAKANLRIKCDNNGGILQLNNVDTECTEIYGDQSGLACASCTTAAIGTCKPVG